jgi:signal peptidase I
MELYDWLQCIVMAIIGAVLIFVFLGRTIGVDGRSMMQTLHHEDRVIMSNLFYTPSGGDIVIFRSPADSFGGTPLVKRVIAVEGQTIDIDFATGEVRVDGIVLNEERYITEPTHSRLDFTGPVTVPEGHVFVMGDNRNSSSDSRDSRVGMVDTRYILGKVLFIAIPGGDASNPRDWSRFGPVTG